MAPGSLQIRATYGWSATVLISVALPPCTYAKQPENILDIFHIKLQGIIMVPFERGVPLVPSVSPGHLRNINMIRLAPPPKHHYTTNKRSLWCQFSCSWNIDAEYARAHVTFYTLAQLPWHHHSKARVQQCNFVMFRGAGAVNMHVLNGKWRRSCAFLEVKIRVKWRRHDDARVKDGHANQIYVRHRMTRCTKIGIDIVTGESARAGTTAVKWS